MRLGTFALLICVWTQRAIAGDFHIHYAEPVSIETRAPATSAAAQKGSSAAISFQAYGREFELELEANDRLLNALSPERRQALSEYQLYRGRLAGIDGSWVRVTRHRGELQGVVWDGRDLYTLAPARSVAPFLVHKLTVPDSTLVVYRLADVDTGLGADFCAAATAGEPRNGLTEYHALVDELQVQTGSLDGQIEMAVLGDREFGERFGANALSELLARINLVDGIFSDQVGVLVVVPDFRLFTNDNPFTTNDPHDLLAELASYRQRTPEIRQRGLAHLFTGRQLEDNTGGIAYLGAVCDPRYGAGLTEGWLDVTASSLIAAHELGHNFGAAHDGDPNEACASTPQTFLMAPNIIGSNRFSQCSLERMRSRVRTAACVTPIDVADVALRGAAKVDVLLGDSVEYALDVESRGSQSANDVVVRIQDLESLGIESVEAENATCFLGDDTYTCVLGTVGGNTTRRIMVRLRPGVLGISTLTGTVSASNDRVPGNDRLYAFIRVAPAADPEIGDASLDAPQSAIGSRPNQAFDYVVRASVAATRAVADVFVDIPLPAMIRVDAMTATGGSCESTAAGVRCELGTIATNSQRDITLRLRSSASGTFATTATLTAADDANIQNNSRTISLVIAPSPTPAARVTTRGGGGGALGWSLIAMLAFLARSRARTGLVRYRGAAQQKSGRMNIF